MKSVRTILLSLIPALFSLTVFASPVDINSASAEDIASSLKGIGASKARAIVAYREKNGAFASVEQLVEVRGIGQALLAKIRQDILLSN